MRAAIVAPILTILPFGIAIVLACVSDVVAITVTIGFVQIAAFFSDLVVARNPADARAGK